MPNSSSRSAIWICMERRSATASCRRSPAVSPGFELRVNKSEVDDVFEVPLAFLMNPANHFLKTREFRDITRSYYEMPYGDRYVWGVTAGILRVLYQRMFAK